MRRLIFACVCLLLAATSFAAGVDHINVTGTDVVQVKPDMVVLTFNVTKQNKALDVAKKEVDTIVAEVLRKLKKYDGTDVKIIANNLSINKNRNYQTGGVIGYSVSMPFEVEVYDLALQNRVLDDLIAAGVDSINPLGYKLRDENAAYDRAMQAALKAAKNRAAKIAAFYGRSLGRVLMVEDGSFANHSPVPVRRMLEAKMMAASPPSATQVMVPDHIDFSFTVYVTYSLK